MFVGFILQDALFGFKYQSVYAKWDSKLSRGHVDYSKLSCVEPAPLTFPVRPDEVKEVELQSNIPVAAEPSVHAVRNSEEET